MRECAQRQMDIIVSAMTAEMTMTPLKRAFSPTTRVNAALRKCPHAPPMQSLLTRSRCELTSKHTYIHTVMGMFVLKCLKRHIECAASNVFKQIDNDKIAECHKNDESKHTKLNNTVVQSLLKSSFNKNHVQTQLCWFHFSFCH